MKSKPGAQLTHRPYAKVSRLPAKIRNRVNQMLYDGVSYATIIAWLKKRGYRRFNQMNISRWRKGAYHAWLNAQERLDHRDFLRHLAKQSKSNDSTFQDAAIHLAQLQFFEALNRLQGADLAILVKQNRKEFIHLLKTFTHFNRFCIQREKFRHDVRRHHKADRQRTQPPKDSVTDENLERICDRFNLK